MSARNETYLGDGLYARDDGFQIWLRTPRENGDHEVALEGSVLAEFVRFIEKSRGLTIKISKGGSDHDETRD